MFRFKAPKVRDTTRFYEQLLAHERRPLFWGKERFDADKISRSASVRRFFLEPVSRILKGSDAVLDLGCGAGVFLPLLAGSCERLVGVDVTPAFVDRARRLVVDKHLMNTVVLEASAQALPLEDRTFDVVLMVDLVHHLPEPEGVLAEVKRVLKPGGKLIVFEPNRSNPVLTLACLIDRNEWGLLALGSIRIYERLFRPHFKLLRGEYNGLLIGPDTYLNQRITEFLSSPRVSPWLGWLNPKLLLIFEPIFESG